MAKHPLRPRKQPRQARASATVEIILQAAARILATESLAGFNTNRVAEVAGVSVGSLYQYFPNKSAMVAALIQRDQTRLGDAIEECLATLTTATLGESLAALVDIAIEHQFGNAVYAAALDHEERRLPLNAVLSASQSRIIAAVQELLKRHKNVIPKGLPTQAAQDCLTITKALVESAPYETIPDLRLLKRRVLRALNGYLQLSRDGERGK
jgi:AcrR family transcriptional regulator